MANYSIYSTVSLRYCNSMSDNSARPDDEFVDVPAGSPYPAAAAPSAAYPGPLAGMPMQAPAMRPNLPLPHVKLTRILAVSILGAILLSVIVGFLPWYSVTDPGTGDTTQHGGWSGQTYDVTYPHPYLDYKITTQVSTAYPATVLVWLFPILIMSIIVACNIGRRGLAIANTVVAAIATLCVIVTLVSPGLPSSGSDDSDAVEQFKNSYDLGAGIGPFLALLLTLAIAGCSIAGIVYGGKPKQPLIYYAPTPPPYPPRPHPQPPTT